MRRGQHGLPQPRREREGGAVRPAPAGLQPVRADDAPAVVGHRARRRPPVDPRRGAHIPPAGRARPPARRGQRGAHRPRVEGQDGHRDAPAAHDLHQGRQRGRGPEHPRRPGQGHTPRLRVDGIRPDGAERRGMARDSGRRVLALRRPRVRLGNARRHQDRQGHGAHHQGRRGPDVPRVRAAHPQAAPERHHLGRQGQRDLPLQRFLRLDAAAAQVARHDRRQDGERHHLDAHGHDVHHPHAAHVGRELAQGDRRLHRRRRGRHARPCQGGASREHAGGRLHDLQARRPRPGRGGAQERGAVRRPQALLHDHERACARRDARRPQARADTQAAAGLREVGRERDAAVGARAAEGRHERDPSHRQELHQRPVHDDDRQRRRAHPVHVAPLPGSGRYLLGGRRGVGGLHHARPDGARRAAPDGVRDHGLGQVVRPVPGEPADPASTPPREGLHRVPRARIQAVRSAPRR